METAYDRWKTAYPAEWDEPEESELTDEELDLCSLEQSALPEEDQ